MAARVLDVVPAHYSDLPRLFARGIFQADVVLLTLSEPDEHGRFNLGLVNDYVVDAARRARVVIAEISDRVPWVCGAELPADIRPHVVVRTSRDPMSLPRKELDDASQQDRVIAQSVASLIPDGATLELGIGTLPDLVLQALHGHRDIGIHSGVLGDGVADLMESGVINNARKPNFRGISVAGMLMGSRRLYDFAHGNSSVFLAAPGETHDIGVLRAIPHFIAINGAIEIDLTGQVNAETVNGKYVGAVGETGRLRARRQRFAWRPFDHAAAGYGAQRRGEPHRPLSAGLGRHHSAQRRRHGSHRVGHRRTARKEPE